MKTEIERAIKVLTSKITKDTLSYLKSDDAMKLSQAVLNLAHTLCEIKAAEDMQLA